MMRNPIPISASATKQDFAAFLQTKWRETWINSPRFVKMAAMGGKFPFNGFRKRLNGLSRGHASMIMQIRSGHIPLNKYLNMIGKLDDDKCHECDHDQGNSPRETVNHFIFDCPTHDEARRDLTATVGRNHFYLSNIMSKTDLMKALGTYINRTGRFKEKEN